MAIILFLLGGPLPPPYKEIRGCHVSSCLPTVCLLSNTEEYNTEGSRLSSLLHLRGSLSGKRENGFGTGSPWLIDDFRGSLGLRGEYEEKGVTTFLCLVLCIQFTALMVNSKFF